MTDALRKIERELEALADEIESDRWCAGEKVRAYARRLAVRIERMNLGLAEVD